MQIKRNAKEKQKKKIIPQTRQSPDTHPNPPEGRELNVLGWLRNYCIRLRLIAKMTLRWVKTMTRRVKIWHNMGSSAIQVYNV